LTSTNQKNVENNKYFSHFKEHAPLQQELLLEHLMPYAPLFVLINENENEKISSKKISFEEIQKIITETNTMKSTEFYFVENQAFAFQQLFSTFLKKPKTLQSVELQSMIDFHKNSLITFNKAQKELEEELQKSIPKENSLEIQTQLQWIHDPKILSFIIHLSLTDKSDVNLLEEAYANFIKAHTHKRIDPDLFKTFMTNTVNSLRTHHSSQNIPKVQDDTLKELFFIDEKLQTKIQDKIRGSFFEPLNTKKRGFKSEEISSRIAQSAYAFGHENYSSFIDMLTRTCLDWNENTFNDDNLLRILDIFDQCISTVLDTDLDTDSMSNIFYKLNSPEKIDFFL
jgi:hypothetical protein